MHTLRYVAGWTFGEISREMGFHYTTVARICGQPTTPTKRSGRPRVLTTPDRRRLVYYATLDAEHRRLPFPEVARRYGIEACDQV